jgi:hypothetical protein
MWREGFWSALEGTENLASNGIRSPDRPGPSQSLYRLLSPNSRCMLTPGSRILVENLTGSQSGNSPLVVESDSSLPRLKEPVTCPYSEPNQSTPSHLLHFLKIHLYMPSTPGSFRLSPKPCIHLSSPSYVLHALRISDTLNLRSTLRVSNHVSHPCKTAGKTIVLYIFIF